ncbi:hypothetical protein DWX10_16150 [Clostridium sp. AF18-27]|uniref:hypothetical protein n=1 Tax=Enterocloster lavalensis TaxID=460384 RepID=UPI000E4AD57A|nr:hypothetical protein [Enterocloster lavalensis]RHR51949.1 hypothetical protein DWX10_16150 [Clostridium sp. AF18-27]
MEELRELGKLASYEDYKKAFDAEVGRIETGFVRIGYMLRVAVDTAILKESGYANMEEFAWAEYRIDKSQASRFVNINKRFSEGGYSDRLQDRFEGYGVAKLGELLTLSDAVIEAIPPELSRTEIQEIKKEIKEEQRITDLEVMMEGHNEAQEIMTSNLDRFMHQYIHDNPEELAELCAAMQSGCGADRIMDALAPAGAAAKMARIQGIGKLMLSIKGKDHPLELLNVRTGDKESCTWEAMQNTIRGLVLCTDPEECYRELYGEPYPPAEAEREAERRRAEVEARKAEEERKAQEERKRVQAEQRAKREREKQQAEKPKEQEPPHEPKKPEVAPVQPKAQVVTEEAENPEPESVHQMQIEEYPEALPEGYVKCHDGTEVVENLAELTWKHIRQLAEELRTGTERALSEIAAQDIIDMYKDAQTILGELEKLMGEES